MTALGFEGRRHKRKAFDATGMIVADGAAPKPCGIADISDSGARLSVSQPQRVPDFFMLFLAANGAVRRQCKVVWRSENYIGVRFR